MPIWLFLHRCGHTAIVWFPNFFRWIDAASRHFFARCGVPRWEATSKTLGIIGTTLVDAHTKFLKTASYGNVLLIRTQITEWREKSFIQTYKIVRTRPDGEEDVILECEEFRISAAKREDGKIGIRAVPIPLSIRLLCERY